MDLKILLRTLHENGDLKSIFYTGELILAVLFGLGIWIFRPKSPESNFRVRESDLRKTKKPQGPVLIGDDSLAQARYPREDGSAKTQAAPLRLEGIRIDGAPHEILGVRADASPAEIQHNYRDLMKRYHPDKVGPPGSREWKDAQKIAEAIISAKERMLKKR